MRSVGLKTLENKLREYVRLAASGETVLISDRDRVVAELVPPREAHGEALSDAILAEAVRRGLISPAALPAAASAPVARLGEILAELTADREER